MLRETALRVKFLIKANILDITFEVNNAKEVVQDILSWLSTFANATVVTVVLVLLFLAFLLNLINKGFFSHMLNILEHKERKRLEQINQYLSSDCAADPETIKAVRDLRDAHYFSVATGIYAENITRKAFIKLHQMSSHRIAWKHIDRARLFIEIAPDETITVRDLNRWDKISYWLNSCVAIVCILFAFYFLMAFPGSSDTKHQATVGFAIGGVFLFFLCIGLYAFFQNLPFFARERIAEELERLRVCPTSSSL
ncbi:MAG: hypothetical protein ACXWAT_01975 [Methylobacter sp.]